VNVSILLLDCSKELAEKLERQGFDVASGNAGYVTPKSFLPGPVYEYEVIIYDPHEPKSSVQTSTGESEVVSAVEPPLEVALKSAAKAELEALQGRKRGTEFDPLYEHLDRGAILLAFINHISDSLTSLNAAYSWLPNMPKIAATQDYKQKH
jgi:hypothetical protein